MTFSAWRKTPLVLGLCTAFLATLAPTVSAEVKLAVIDTQRAVMETEDGLRAAANLKKLFENRQKQLDDRQNELTKERDEIQKQSGVLSKEALQKRAEKWQRDMLEVQNTFVEYQKELQKKQGEITQPILQKAMSIIRRLATQNGYDIVIEKQAVPYNRSDLDLTDRVITIYNGGGALDAADPKAAPAAGETAKPASSTATTKAP